MESLTSRNKHNVYRNNSEAIQKLLRLSKEVIKKQNHIENQKKFKSGEIDNFDKERYEKSIEEIVKMDPDSLEYRINLAFGFNKRNSILLNLNRAKLNSIQKSESLERIKETKSTKELRSDKHKSLSVSRSHRDLSQKPKQRRLMKRLQNLSKNLLNLKKSLDTERKEMSRSRSEIMSQKKKNNGSNSIRHFVAYGNFVCKDKKCPYNCNKSLQSFTKNYAPYGSKR